MKLTWCGHSCFLLETEQGRVVFDPYEPGYVPGIKLPELEAELCLTELDSTRFDGVILPGGMGGSQALAATQGVLELIKEYDAAGKLVCAICAAPALVLTAAGILPGRPATCYPAPDFTAALGAEYRREKAVVSGNLITAEGPGRARAIIVKVKGEEAARQTFADALLED